VKEEKSDNLEAFSCRLEREQISFIEDLTKRRVLGSNKNVVLRALISYAMQHMAETEFIQKYRAMRDGARKA
jgi:hypothetical protein